MRRLGRVALGLVTVGILWFNGCSSRKENLVKPGGEGRALLEQTIKEFHHPSADATGADRERLLREAATRYEQLLKQYPEEQDLCAQALLGLGNVRASQGKTNEAVKLYATMGDRYPNRDWEVLQAWKAAADLLWDARRRDEAKKYYARIVERFDKSDAPMITKTVVRGSKARLGE